MARTAKPAAEIIEADINHEVFKQASDTLNQSALMDLDSQARATEIATQLNYEGSLTVGAVEDEIRFYMRRTVEDCLQLGTRLLILKELTPHGEFEQRIETLGIGIRTAQSFMNATRRASKSETVALLSSQAKNVKAFLEMVTMDDDELNAIAELDDIDRMSASEIRKLARAQKSEIEAKEQVISDKNKMIDKLDTKLKINKPHVVALTDWPTAFAPLFDQAHEASRLIQQRLDALQTIINTALQTEAEDGNEDTLNQAREMLADEFVKIHDTIMARATDVGFNFDRTLGSFANKRLRAYDIPTDEAE